MPNVDVSQALDLKLNHGLGVRRIAKIQGTSKSAVHKALQKILPTRETEIYQANRADILSQLQLTLLQQVDTRRLKKISARDAVISAGVLYDKEMLERGKSPSTKPVLVIVKGDNCKIEIGSGSQDALEDAINVTP